MPLLNPSLITACTQGLTGRNLPRLLLGWALLALVLRAISHAAGLAEEISLALVFAFLGITLCLRLFPRGGLESAQHDLLQLWDKLSYWLHKVSWVRLFACGLLAYWTLRTLFWALFVHYAHSSALSILLLGLVTSTIAAKVPRQPVSATPQRTSSPVEATSTPMTQQLISALLLILIIVAASLGLIFLEQLETPHWINIHVQQNSRARASAPMAASQAGPVRASSIEGVTIELASPNAPHNAAAPIRPVPPSHPERTRRLLPASDDHNPGMSFAAFLVIILVAKIFARDKWRAEQAAEFARGDAELARLAHEAAEARLAAMQAQIEPHFLFNTMASVDQLIQTDPARASQLQKNLIRFLRAAIPQIRNEAARSTLGRQVEMSRAYLEIMQVRMAERLHYAIQISPELLEAEFPPMMLQTLIENAIKHGLEPAANGGHLIINAKVLLDRLYVRVENTGQSWQGEPQTPGMGLANLRERLHLLYADAATLSLAANPEGGCIAEITLPYRPGPTEPRPA